MVRAASWPLPRRSTNDSRLLCLRYNTRHKARSLHGGFPAPRIGHLPSQVCSQESTPSASNSPCFSTCKSGKSPCRRYAYTSNNTSNHPSEPTDLDSFWQSPDFEKALRTAHDETQDH